MGSIGDIFQLVMKQTYLGQECLNVFFYRQISENTDPDITSAQALASAFDQDVCPAIAGIQIEACEFDTLEVINLFDPGDLNSRNITAVSTGAIVATDALNTFHAMEYRTSRVTRAIRRGFKRFTGMDESMVIVGQLNPSFYTVATAVKDAMNATIQQDGEPLTPNFQPVIVKRIKYVTSSGSTAYRLPTDVVEAEYYKANFLYTRVSTQNSRKSW